jgi:hypothetical protein
MEITLPLCAVGSHSLGDCDTVFARVPHSLRASPVDAKGAAGALPHLLDAVALCSDDVRLHALIIRCCGALGGPSVLLPHRLPPSP